MNKTIPWVEKYRPKELNTIILNPYNKKFINNIIKSGYFPNLLFYGPPGTGKTTTIINLINKYQEKYNCINKGHIIHLNASDERGIDTIRTQIYQFVLSKNIIGNGMKFVILDEIDYMTKNAQKALKYIIQNNNLNVRFCIICNYISKIDISLQNEFVKIKFYNLNKKDIKKFLKNICLKENIRIKNYQLENILFLFKHDIRSMINYIQSNYLFINKNFIIKNKTYLEIIDDLKNNKNIELIYSNINKLVRNYNINKCDIVENIINILIKKYNTNDWIDLYKCFLRNISNNNGNDLTYFFLFESSKLFKTLK